jgi:hypothetical protein
MSLSVSKMASHSFEQVRVKSDLTELNSTFFGIFF